MTGIKRAWHESILLGINRAWHQSSLASIESGINRVWHQKSFLGINRAWHQSSLASKELLGHQSSLASIESTSMCPASIARHQPRVVQQIGISRGAFFNTKVQYPVYRIFRQNVAKVRPDFVLTIQCRMLANLFLSWMNRLFCISLLSSV